VVAHDRAVRHPAADPLGRADRALAGAAGAVVAAQAQTLKAVKDRGALVCGVSEGLLGFSAKDAKGEWSGFDVDFCRALGVGAVGTMTLGVMTRATLGHSGRALAAGAGTSAIYALVTIGAALRVLAPFTAQALILTSLAGAAWSAAFLLFAILYAPIFFANKK